MNRKHGTLIAAAAGAALLLAGAAKAEEKGVEWTTLQSAKVSLEKGFAAAQPKGKPISGKFEMAEGKLQLSVYTAGQGKFWEVIVDHASGKISKTDEITGGEDLEAAQKQAKAMAKTMRSLRDVLIKAEKANAGYRAVSVMPEIEKGAVNADVELL